MKTIVQTTLPINLKSRPTKLIDISYYKMKGNIVDCKFGPTTSDPLDLYQCISSNGLNQMGPRSGWIFHHLVNKRKWREKY